MNIDVTLRWAANCVNFHRIENQKNCTLLSGFHKNFILSSYQTYLEEEEEGWTSSYQIYLHLLSPKIFLQLTSFSPTSYHTYLHIHNTHTCTYTYLHIHILAHIQYTYLHIHILAPLITKNIPPAHLVVPVLHCPLPVMRRRTETLRINLRRKQHPR